MRDRATERRMRKSTLRWALRAAVVLGCAGALAGAYFFHVAAQVLCGYKAKMVCTGVFVSGRSREAVEREDLVALDFLRTEVEGEKRRVTVSLLGLWKRIALSREGLGCTLVLDTSERELRRQPVPDLTPAALDPGKPWPEGNGGDPGGEPQGVSRERLGEVLDWTFREPVPGMPRRKTRAVVVVQDGRIVAERYASGITAETALPGWSLAKGVLNALVGILAGEGKLALDAPAPVPEWGSPGDPRGAITLDQLMKMTSGQRFRELVDPVPFDALMMLGRTGDAASYAARLPLVAPPGTRWNYSSGASNILSRIVRHAVGGAHADYWAFPRRALFDRIGMASAVAEPDASGVLLLSTCVEASARDWARLGLLYLDDGVWRGARILPEGWVEYSRTPSGVAPRLGQYGAHVWTNAGQRGAGAHGARWMPRLPADAFGFWGMAEQYLLVVPSRGVVLVRLGLTWDLAAWDAQEFAVRVLEALPDGGA